MRSITALSTLRMGVGVSLLAVPELATKACLLPAIPGATIATRMAGIRDLALGAFTLYVNRQAFGNNKSSGSNGGGGAALAAAKPATPSGPNTSLLNGHSAGVSAEEDINRQSYGHVLRSVLALNIAVDAMDILGCLWCLGEGNLGVKSALIIGGGAAVFLDVGIFAMIRRQRALAREAERQGRESGIMD